MAPPSPRRATPWLYQALGVPDTLDGRFDLIALHAFLLIHRLQDAPEPGPALAQAVFDAMFRDMDQNLREIGVGDLSVGNACVPCGRRSMAGPRPMPRPWGWAGRRWRPRSTATSGVAPHRTARPRHWPASFWRNPPHLAGQPLAALAGGAVDFLPAEEASR